VPFLQNHDQVGNRALGERLTVLAPAPALRLAAATLLLAPSIPMLFMGEEYGATTPFLYFCDFEGELARAVREGRRREFAAFERFRDAAARESLPDPGAEETFRASKLDWGDLALPVHAAWLERYRRWIAIRAREIVPRLGERAAGARFEVVGATGLAVDWTLADGSRLHLRANFGAAPAPIAPAPGRVLHVEGAAPHGATMQPWSGAWSLEAA
jgi:maltooligosyltrehalose trehalohydrolase